MTITLHVPPDEEKKVQSEYEAIMNAHTARALAYFEEHGTFKGYPWPDPPKMDRK
jgi:hypothetical protein